MLSLVTYKRSLSVALILVLCLGAILHPSAVHANEAGQEKTPTAQDVLSVLTAFSLTTSDMSEDFILSETGQLDLLNDSHPLNSAMMTNLNNCSTHNNDAVNATATCADVFGYAMSYGFAGHLPNTSSFVANYLYAFSNQIEAEKAAKTIVDSWRQVVSNVIFLEQFASEGTEYSKAISFAGEANDTVYWYVIVRNGILELLLVNGIDQQSTAAVFSSAIENIVQKTPPANFVRKVYLPVINNGSVNEQVVAAKVDGWQTAYAVGVAFWTWYPHYAAKFSGRNGRNQSYTGPTGTPPGFRNWTWYNDYGRNQLLLDSTWYWSTSGSGNRSHYHAYLDCPC